MGRLEPSHVFQSKLDPATIGGKVVGKMGMVGKGRMVKKVGLACDW